MSEEKTQLKRVVLVEGQLQKIIHEEGEGQLPSKGQEVSALYRGTLQNGNEFDSNQNRDNPFKFTLGQGMVIKGWDVGFASMKIGEKATLICSPDYAYGKRGSPPRIPPNSTLHFEVELLNFEDKEKQKFDMSPQEKVQSAKKLKEEGNASLKEGRYRQAIKKYKDGIDFVETEDDEDSKAILKILRLNISQAYLKNKTYTKAIDNCSKVLKDDSKNVKALYRRGCAYFNNQEYDSAKDDFTALLEIDPNNAEAKNELVKVNEGVRKALKKEKKVFGGMFSSGGLYDDMKEKKEEDRPKDEEDEENSEEMPELEKEKETEEKKEEKAEKEDESKQ